MDLDRGRRAATTSDISQPWIVKGEAHAAPAGFGFTVTGRAGTTR